MAEPEDVRAWVAQVWPGHDWSRATVSHGAFHQVAVLEQTLVARVAGGPDAAARTRAEAATLQAVAGLDLPVEVPRLIGEVMEHEGAAGVLTTFVPGGTREAAWLEVRGPLADLLAGLREVPAGEVSLAPVRAWCGGPRWPEIVAEDLGPLLPRGDLEFALRLLQQVHELERDAPRAFVHGDLGLHNIHWDAPGSRSGRAPRPTGLIDLDHAAWADPAIDVAPLIGQFSAAELGEIVEPDLLRRAMWHRATLSLQVAAAAHLGGDEDLRDTALDNFVTRHAQGTSFDPGGEVPA